MKNDATNLLLNDSPTHVAIIMDGNGRWATREKKSVIEGHRRGAENAKALTRKALQLGIRYLTLYTFSSENWLRPAGWVEQLMQLLRYYLQQEASDIFKDKICLRVIGDRTRLPADILSVIESLEQQTAGNTQMTLIIALSYGSRDEIVQAVQRITQAVTAGQLSPEAIDAEQVQAHLYTTGIPDPDLLIRTGGDRRISNFLLWQLAYSELLFVDKLWPDFNETNFVEALQDYASRERRFGASFGAYNER
ncbi:MAG: polyprenyl diphosphate synthase [Alphaproteobacteria bacterium]